MILLTEIIVLLVIFTIVYMAGLKKQLLKGLHNLPKPIQERVRELPEYEGKVKGDILTTKQRIVKKLPVLLIVAVFFSLLTYLCWGKGFSPQLFILLCDKRKRKALCNTDIAVRSSCE